jgi:hypothetical protein
MFKLTNTNFHFSKLIKIKNIYPLINTHNKITYSFIKTKSNYFQTNNSNEKMTFKQKMKVALEREKKEQEKYSKDTEYVEEKFKEIFIKEQVIRSPFYISILPLIWSNPFSYSYSALLLFNNYYLIFLTGLEVKNILI